MKKFWASKTFASKTFASGMFTGIGVSVVSNPVPGIQFTHRDDRIDFTAHRRVEFTSNRRKPDFTSEGV